MAKNKDNKKTSWSAGKTLTQRAESYQTIARHAVIDAKSFSHKMGVPVSFIENKKICYELPDGTITSKNPFEK